MMFFLIYATLHLKNNFIKKRYTSKQKKTPHQTLFKINHILEAWMIITHTKRQTPRQLQLYSLGEIIQSGEVKRDNHSIRYEVRGNPTATPVFIHNGGPGGEYNDEKFQKFNPKKYMIICYDQRGCGKSKVTGDILSKNNLAHLIDDIYALHEHLKIEHAIHYGNSWGSTLALHFAIQYPQKVSKLFLSGIFFGGKDSTIDLLKRYEDITGETISISEYKKLCRKVIGGSLEHAKQLVKIEGALYTNEDSLQTALESAQNFEWTTAIQIFAHFEYHDCFTNKKNLFAKIKVLQMPIIIINGNRDLITPPKNAYELYTQIKKHNASVTLYILPGGHRGHERMNLVIPILNEKNIENFAKM
jgi:proline iminopeptidase